MKQVLSFLLISLLSLNSFAFIPVHGDYNGDGIEEMSIYDEFTGTWYIKTISGQILCWAYPWGGMGMKAVSGDYNGDGCADFAVYSESTGNWYIKSSNGEIIAWEIAWGGWGYKAVSGDFNGDKISDLAVYHESDGNWYISTVNGQIILWQSNWGGLGNITKLNKFATTPQEFLGYGYVNKWIELSDQEMEMFAEILAQNGLTITQVELLSAINLGAYHKSNYAVDRFKVFAREMKKRNITILLTIVNWNYGKFQNFDSIQNPAYDIVWFQNIVNRIINEIGMDGIILEACSEWNGNSTKIHTFCEWSSEAWGGMKSWNYESRPAFLPPRYDFLDYHSFSTSDIGPVNCILVTDTTSIIEQLGGGLYNYADPNKVKQYASVVKNNSKGFIYYAFFPPYIDFDTIKAIGELIQ